MRAILVALVMMAAGCATDDAKTDIPRADACREQAAAWCARTGNPMPGCRLVYAHWCDPDGIDDTIATEAQDACLSEISEMPAGRVSSATTIVVPPDCIATW